MPSPNSIAPCGPPSFRYPSGWKNIERCNLLVSYNYRFRQDTLSGTYYNDMYALEIGDNVTHFYSLFARKCDSILYASKVSVNNTSWMSEGQGANWEDFYTGYPAKGTTRTTISIDSYEFFYDEPSLTPNWDILPDTMSIMGYLCNKAVTTYKGRKWDAWFTMEIPIQKGPWKLSGLPGLILKATDSKGYFDFEAVGVEQTTDRYVSAYHNPLRKSKKLNRNHYNNLLRKRWEDPVSLKMANDIEFAAFSPDGQYSVLKPGDIRYAYIPTLELE